MRFRCRPTIVGRYDCLGLFSFVGIKLVGGDKDDVLGTFDDSRELVAIRKEGILGELGMIWALPVKDGRIGKSRSSDDADARDIGRRGKAQTAEGRRRRRKTRRWSHGWFNWQRFDLKNKTRLS
jgi:hypothetical protein